jgi:signal transduction histidine kinase
MKNILAVDDLEENRYMLESLLTGSGYKVVSAKNGVEALEKLRKEPFDIIISDILMPEMDGFVLCRECKNDETLRKIPFLFYTATYTDEKDEAFALGLGAEKFIIKPKEPDELLKIIKNAIEELVVTAAFSKKLPEKTDYLTGYNERLVHKLEDKVLDLRDEVAKHRKTEEKLKKSMEIKSEFVAMVSHELRTPLTAIKEGIALVFDGLVGKINEEQKELLGISKKNVERLARLINEVLDIQKLDSGMMKFNLETNNINEVAKGVYETMVVSAKKANLELSLELDDNLPMCSFDNDKITQVLTNLVANALKFTTKGNITIKTGRDDNSIRVSVSDTGCGIKGEDMPKIFNRFEQVGTGGERKTGGTGLGLAISKEIIERHNGTIWFESTFGKGSKFTFTLPKTNQTEKVLLKEMVL